MHAWRLATIVAVLGAALAAPASADFVTEQWGNTGACRHRGTVGYTRKVLTFDLSALQRGSKVYRAVLRPGIRRSDYSGTIRLCPITAPAKDPAAEPEMGRPLTLRPPLYDSFDATEMVRAWAADPKKNLGLYVKWSPRLRADGVVLEISHEGRAREAIPAVTGLEALHQAGQTFLTWKEIEDPVGADAPTFEQFHNAVMAARQKRSIVYRVYRSDQPIRVETLGEAQLVAEVPEIITCWNLKAVRNTEHPNQGTPTMRSPLRPGYNNARNHVMTRYRIAEGAEPLPRATGLWVVTVNKPGRRHYAVTASVNGAEAVGKLQTVTVDEKTSPFPAMVRVRSYGKVGRRSRRVDVYNAWVGPPYHNLPTQTETYMVHWSDLPEGGPENLRPLWVVCGTYGSTAATLQNPGWWGARKHLTGAVTLGLAEGGLWEGFHECIGTLRSYDQGVVCNYPQRRVLAAAAWGVWKKDLYVDPQRVYHWAQLGSWALRHGDVFAVVMSNGYGNPAIGKQAQKHASKWGPPGVPEGSKNWLGAGQWEYMDIARYVRENPTVELPYWLCWPAYGAYPSHTIGDFGFLPWTEMIHAMASTKRAFAATWNTNGPGVMRGLFPLVTRIRRDQALPAFTHCNLDANPGDGDHSDAQKSGGINVYQLWEPETIVDRPDRFEITLTLRKDCPEPACITDLTPRRCQKFSATPGQRFQWTLSALDGSARQKGAATADKWGLVTVEKLKILPDKSRLVISRAD